MIGAAVALDDVHCLGVILGDNDIRTEAHVILFNVRIGCLLADHLGGIFAGVNTRGPGVHYGGVGHLHDVAIVSFEDDIAIAVLHGDHRKINLLPSTDGLFGASP